MRAFLSTWMNKKHWPIRAAAAACLLACGLLWSLHRRYGVTEIRHGESPAYLPVASLQPTDDDWPSMFGVSGDGTSPRAGLPRDGSGSYVPEWHIALRDPANGGPCVWGNLVVTP